MAKHADIAQTIFNTHAAVQLAILPQFSEKSQETNLQQPNGLPKYLTPRMVQTGQMPNQSHT